MTKKYSMFEEYDSAYNPGGKGTQTYTPRCYTTHPVLTLGAGTLHGGSCSYPKKDMDVYVGLDSWMSFQQPGYPWLPKAEAGPQEVLFKITDGSPPEDSENFIKMIDWLATKLNLGANVHVGCMGGHGRTGLVLAALVKKINNEPDAIAWVREHYCKKAVETKSQVNFLVNHFGILPAEPSRAEYNTSTYSKKKGKKGKKDDKDGYVPFSDFGSTSGQTYLPRTNDRFIPGTSIPRSTGPRDLVESFTAISLPGSSLSIWNDRLTNAK